MAPFVIGTAPMNYSICLRPGMPLLISNLRYSSKIPNVHNKMVKLLLLLPNISRENTQPIVKPRPLQALKMNKFHEGLRRLGRWVKAACFPECYAAIVFETHLQDFLLHLHEHKLPLPQLLYLIPEKPRCMRESTFRCPLKLEALSLQAKPMPLMQASGYDGANLPEDRPPFVVNQ